MTQPNTATNMSITDIVLNHIKSKEAHAAKLAELKAATEVANARKTPTGRLTIKDKKLLAKLDAERGQLLEATNNTREALDSAAADVLTGDEVALRDRRNNAEAGLREIVETAGHRMVDATEMYDSYIKRYNLANNETLALASESKYARYFRLTDLNYYETEPNYFSDRETVKKAAEVHVALYFDEFANVREVHVLRGAVRDESNTRNTSPLVDAYRVEIRVKSGADATQSFSSHRDTPESMRVYAKVLNLVALIMEGSGKVACEPVLSARKKADAMMETASGMIARGELNAA